MFFILFRLLSVKGGEFLPKLMLRLCIVCFSSHYLGTYLQKGEYPLKYKTYKRVCTYLPIQQ